MRDGFEKVAQVFDWIIPPVQQKDEKAERKRLAEEFQRSSASEGEGVNI